MEQTNIYRKVLVPIDGSVASFHALDQAFQFSSVEKSWITAVCVAPFYQGDLDTLVAKDAILAKMRSPCEKTLTKAREIAAGKGYSIDTTLLEDGEPSRLIAEYAEANSQEMIIMGRRGLARLQRVLVGSVTQRVIGQSRKDVVVVPEGAPLSWEKILVATDGSPCSQAAVERAVYFATIYGSKVEVVSVIDQPAQLYGEAPDMAEVFSRLAVGYAENAAQFVKDKGVEATAHAFEGTAYQVIPELARSLGARLIIVGSHGRTGMPRLLMGSVAEKIIGYAACPVLVARL